MLHIAQTTGAMFCLEGGACYCGDVIPQLIQTGLLAAGYVVDLVDSIGIRSKQGQFIGLYGIGDISEVTGLATIAIDGRRDVFLDGLKKQRNNRCIGAIRILPGSKDIKVALPDKLHGI